MIRFRDYLEERVLSIGLNPKHEHHREKHRQEMHDMLRRAYKDIGGYGSLGHGSKEESDDIHKDISHHAIKAVKRDGKISALRIYKKQHGRKMIATATDGTDRGKADWKKTSLEDHEQKRAWGEASGAVEHIQTKMGMPKVSAHHAEKLLGKKVTPSADGVHYTRRLGNHDHTKVIMGHPKHPDIK